jgi:hypothetical protein
VTTTPTIQLVHHRPYVRFTPQTSSLYNNRPHAKPQVAHVRQKPAFFWAEVGNDIESSKPQCLPN